jgi:hypothetical protein
MSTLFGTDIQLDDEGDIIIDSGGDLMLAVELDCLIQDVKNRLITYPGDLFTDETYGVGLQEFTNSEDTEINRLHVTQMITLKLSEEPRIEVNSLKVTVVDWKEHEIIVSVIFTPINSDNPINIILTTNSAGIEVT